MCPEIVLMGSGGLAQEILDMFQDFRIGYTKGDMDFRHVDGHIEENLRDSEGNRVRYVVAVADPKTKKRMVDLNPELAYLTLIHPMAMVSSKAKIGVGSVIMPNAIIDPDVTIGSHVTVSYGAFVGHHAKIGDYSTIRPYAVVSGWVNVGEGVEIGAHAFIENEHFLERGARQIGRFARVGAGAVVTKDVAEEETVVGIPAHKLEK